MVIDVDLDASLLTVSDRERRKTERSAAAVPIPPELVEILRAWIPRCASRWVFPGIRRKGPWTGGACGERACDQIRQAGQDVGVAGLTLMSLRHTWATHARRTWGLSEIEVATVLRHSSPATQAWYVHDDPDPGAIVRSVEKVSYQRKDKQSSTPGLKTQGLEE
jgi:integrase